MYMPNHRDKKKAYVDFGVIVCVYVCGDSDGSDSPPLWNKQQLIQILRRGNL